MAIIPLRQTIKVTRVVADPNDIWGNGSTVLNFSYKCRVVEGSYLTVGEGSSKGGTIVATAKILLDKLVDINYEDEISYTDELGHTIKRKPLRISVKRGFDGKPILTEVLI